MKLLLALLFPLVAFAGPCDGNPRVKDNVTMTCQLTSLTLSTRSLLEVRAQSANTQTTGIIVEIGWRTITASGRLSQILRFTGFPFDRTTTFDLPVAAVIEFVQLDEISLTSSAGFIQ